MTGILLATTLAGEIFAWQGEKTVVWHDMTNDQAAAVTVMPKSDKPFVKVGLAMPVRGDGDSSCPDRIVWGGSACVSPGARVRVVAEVAAPVRSEDFRLDCGVAGFDWRVSVAPRQFPAGRARALYLDLWQHPWAVARYFAVKPFSPAHYARMRPLWEFLAEMGQKTVTTTIMARPWAHQCHDAYGSMVRHIRTEDGRWRFDYTVFDEYVAFARACGLGRQIHCYTICPFRLKRYYWENARGEEVYGDFDVGSPEFVDYWRAFLDDFAAHQRAKGWFDDTYIALDERSPDELKAAVRLVRQHGHFKIALAGDRAPSLFDGIDIDNFSIALPFVTARYVEEVQLRRRQGRHTSVYVAGGHFSTGLRDAPETCQWLGTYPGAADVDGFLRWAYNSWPANPNDDATYEPPSYIGKWAAGGTYLMYPETPSLRLLALRNGLNLSEKLMRLRREGRVDGRLSAALRKFDAQLTRKPPCVNDLVEMMHSAARETHRLSTCP